ncbi:hypothetical protein A2U01_0060772, partial [Trifolium medium]|nr:hypothetical protein [Trifolium medium]
NLSPSMDRGKIYRALKAKKSLGGYLGLAYQVSSEPI